MADEFHDPVWQASKKGGRIGGTVGFVVGFFGPPILTVIALLLPPPPGNDDYIGALFPFLGIVLGPLGFIGGGLIGMAIGWFIGVLHRHQNIGEDEKQPIAKP